MADQNVSIGFNAEISGFMAGVSAMRGAVGGMVGEIEKSAKARKGLADIGKAAGLVGVAAAAGLGAAVVAAANFDQAMSRTAAATHESAGNMGALRDAAIQAGQATQFSATEAADAITAMAKAGVSTADILGGGLTGALNLAAAGELDVAQAADIAATTLNQFGLAGSDVGHVADLLAAGAGKAQGEVTDFATSLKYVGPVAAQMGVSLEETTGVIAELASQGILGSQAGTSLRGMLSSLTSPSAEAAAKMKELGVNMYDAQGAFVGFDGIAGQLHEALDGLSAAQRDQALGTLFGNQQITAARILYKGGADAVHGWTSAVDDSGFAAETAALKMDNLKGDLEKLKGSLETALIGTGSGSQGPLRSLVQGLEDVTNAYNKLPSGVHGGIANILGLTALAGIGTFGFTKIVSGIGSARTAMADLAAQAPKTAAALRGIGKGFTAIVIVEAFNAIGQSISDMIESSDAAAPSLEALQRNLENLGRAGALAGLQRDLGDIPAALDAVNDGTGNLLASTQGFNDKVPFLGGMLKGLTDVEDQLSGGNLQALREGQAVFESLDQSLTTLGTSEGPKQAQRAFEQLATSYGITGEAQARLMAQLPQFKALLEDSVPDPNALTSGFAGLKGNSVVGWLSGVGGAAHDAAAGVDDLSDALAGLTGFFDRRAALRDYRESLATFSETVKDGGGNFNRLTEKGRTAQASLDGVATSALKVADGMKDANKTKFLRQTAGDIEAVARRMGILGNKDIQGVINKLREAGRTKAEPKVEPQGIPQTHSELNGVEKHMAETDKKRANPVVRAIDQASAVIRRIIGEINNVPANKTVTITTNHVTHYTNTGGPPTSGGFEPEHRARGGLLRGPGTGTSDSINLRGSNGEYMVRAAAVRHYGPKMFDDLNAMRWQGSGATNAAPSVTVNPNVSATVALSETQFGRLEAAVERGAARGFQARERAARADRRVG